MSTPFCYGSPRVSAWANRRTNLSAATPKILKDDGTFSLHPPSQQYSTYDKASQRQWWLSQSDLFLGIYAQTTDNTVAF